MKQSATPTGHSARQGQGLYGPPVPQQTHYMKEALGQVSSNWMVREGAPRGCGSVKATTKPRPLLGAFLGKVPAFGLCPVTPSAATTTGVEVVTILWPHREAASAGADPALAVCPPPRLASQLQHRAAMALSGAERRPGGQRKPPVRATPRHQ